MLLDMKFITTKIVPVPMKYRGQMNKTVGTLVAIKICNRASIPVIITCVCGKTDSSLCLEQSQNSQNKASQSSLPWGQLFQQSVPQQLQAAASQEDPVSCHC